MNDSLRAFEGRSPQVPSVVDPYIAALGPAQLIQPLQKRREVGM
jgi:hypothetical protein